MICPAKTPQELLAEFRASGRQEPFEEIVRRYAAMVFHVCFQVLRNRHDAEDATQAVFLTLAVQGKTNKEIRNIGPWLQQVAKRLSLDLRKAKKRRAAREQRHGLDNSNGGNELALGSGLDGQEMRHILSEELNQLAPKYRLPLILHYFGGLSREQMSQELGCKEATLGVRLHRGREMLAARLSQRGVALTAVGLGMLLSYMVREAVTENLIWQTSHVASQMAAGHPVGAGMVSARAMALARSAGTTLAVSKVKAIVASVLIAATAVAAGEVVSKVRPMDLRLQGPAGDRLLELIRPKLPQFRSDATPPQPPPAGPSIANAQKEATKPLDSTFVGGGSADLLRSASGAEWGGSILGGRWVTPATSTHIPGILWSSAAPPNANGVSYNARGIAVGPLAAPLMRAAEQQRIPFMAAPYAATASRPKRSPQGGSASPQFQIQLAPGEALPEHRELAINTGPKLYLEPSSIDARTHPITPISNPTPTTSYGTNSSGVIVAISDGGVFTYDNLDSAVDFQLPRFIEVSDNEFVRLTQTTSYVIRAGVDSNLDLDHHGRGVHSARPTALTPPPPTPPRLTFDSASSIIAGRGIIKGYGIASAALELNENGQIIADGSRQERTLDLSAVGTIKNSIDNARNGHNGWFAQHKGKLVLPAVAFNDGQATFGEDASDPQLDLINSVRLSVSSDVVGAIKLSLLSPDRTDYAAMPANVKPIGLWHVESMDMVLSSVDVTVRYDVDLANDLRLNSNLNLWGYDGEWKLAEGGSVDSTNHLIQGHLTGIDYFAVAGSVQTPTHPTGTPEPTTILGLVCAGLILARRRRL